MVTSESLYLASNISPSDFGANIVDPNDDDEDQRASAIAHIETSILPKVKGEVDVPLMKSSNGSPLPLPENLLSRRYPRLDAPRWSLIQDNLQNLYDAAVTSYGRFEINKQIASNDRSYNENSDDNRKAADAQLEKLLDMVCDIIEGKPDLGFQDEIITNKPISQSIQAVYGF